MRGFFSASVALGGDHTKAVFPGDLRMRVRTRTRAAILRMNRPNGFVGKAGSPQAPVVAHGDAQPGRPVSNLRLDTLRAGMAAGIVNPSRPTQSPLRAVYNYAKPSADGRPKSLGTLAKASPSEVLLPSGERSPCTPHTAPSSRLSGPSNWRFPQTTTAPSVASCVRSII